MFRLLLSELKKIIYHKLTVLGICVAIAVTIGVSSFFYAENTGYSKGGYTPDIDKIPGGNGFDLAIRVMYNMDQRGADVNLTLESVEDLIGVNMKSELKTAINKLIGCNNDLNALLLPDEPYLMPPQNVNNIGREYLDGIFGPEGADYNNIDKIREVYIKVGDTLNYIDSIINYVYFNKKDYNRYNYYYFTEDFRKNYFYENFSAIDNFYECRLSYYELGGGAVPGDLKNRVKNLPTRVNAIIHKKVDMLAPALLNEFLEATNNAISMNVTNETFEYLNDFLNRESGVKNRLKSYRDIVQEYLEKENLNEKETDRLALIGHRHDNMVKRTLEYIDRLLLLNNFAGFSDSYLDNYRISGMGKKYDMKKYLTVTEYVVVNGLHFSDYDLQSADMVAEGYYPAGEPLNIDAIVGGGEYDAIIPVNIYTYIRWVFSILSLIIIVICVFLGGNLIAAEQSNGTIKLLLIRPYKRWKILTAKILITIIIAICLILVSLGLLFALGLIMGFSISPHSVLTVFNANHAFVMSAFGELLLQILFMIISLIIYTVIAAFFSAAFKAKTAAVVLVLLLSISTALLNQFLRLYQAFKFFIVPNIELYAYYGSGSHFNDMSFIFSAAICLVYALAAGFGAYYIFGKKDL